MSRIVKPELLDELPPADPRAVHSRRDLVRINACMGNAAAVAVALTALGPARSRTVLELGAGDGQFLLSVARRLSPAWKGTAVLLLDQQPIVPPELLAAFSELGWQAACVQAEALAWLEQPSGPRSGVIVANLFLHHLNEAQLRRLFCAARERADAVIALEPRRCRRGAFFSRLLWLIGCNAVTRHDARVSIQAGFAGQELSQLWPDPGAWTLREQPSGSFGHLFVAHRNR